MYEKEQLRHSLATIHYRGMKYLKNFKTDFPDVVFASSIRSPEEILNHINGLLLYMESCFIPLQNTYPEALDFQGEVCRFVDSIKHLDSVILEHDLRQYSYKRIQQGPIADILLHIGELSMLRQISNDPADDLESYIDAEIDAGYFNLEK